MRQRNGFRPTGWEVLEDRTLPSHGGLPALTVGALGDSYTDEYQFYGPHQSQARNWLEILAATRAVQFGPFTTDGRGEPRNQGFAFNWARGGATSGDMVRNQLPGLAAQVRRGEVRYAWVFIGSNDFDPFLHDAARGRVPLAQARAGLAQVEARLETNFLTAVNRLLAANPNARVVVSTLFDLTRMPWVQRLGPQAGPLLDAVQQSIRKFNALVRSTAAGNGRVALVDLDAMMDGLVREAGPAGAVRFGGTTLDLTRRGDDFHHLFLADSIHLGTVFQGMIADAFVGAVDSLGAHVHPLSPEHLVWFARHFTPDTP